MDTCFCFRKQEFTLAAIQLITPIEFQTTVRVLLGVHKIHLRCGFLIPGLFIPIDGMFNTAYCKKQTENIPYGKIPSEGPVSCLILKNSPSKLLITNSPIGWRRCTAWRNSIPCLRVEKDRDQYLASIYDLAPNPFNLPEGYVFYQRFTKCIPDVCDKVEHPVVKVGSDHQVRCILCK